MEKRFEKIKDHILGKEYELSLVFAKNSLMKELNFRYKKKNVPTNVLAFPLDKSEGEIFINISDKKNAVFLLIHALLHLKGYKHGVKMENAEKTLMDKFNYGEKHNNRN